MKGKARRKPPTVTTPEEAPTPEFDEGDDWSDTYGESHRLSRAALSEEADRKHDAMQNMASRPESLHDALAHQLGFMACEPPRSGPWPII